MRYLVLMSAGLALLAAGLTAVEYALYHLIQAGACITNGDFLADNAGCVTDNGSWGQLLPPGIGIGFVGVLVFAARGTPPDDPPPARRLNAGVVAWSAALVASGATIIAAVTAPESGIEAGTRTTGIAGGCALIAVGVLPLLRELLLIARSRSAARDAPASYEQPWTPTPAPEPSWTPTPAPPAAPAEPEGPTPIDRLNALARQRDSGEISAEEFERRKAEVLSDMTRGL